MTGMPGMDDSLLRGWRIPCFLTWGRKLVEKQTPVMFSVRTGHQHCQLHTKIRNKARRAAG